MTREREHMNSLPLPTKRHGQHALDACCDAQHDETLYLFVGGPADGKRMVTGGEGEVSVPVEPRGDMCQPPEPFAYWLITFADKEGTGGVYAPVGVGLVETFKRLMAFYNAGRVWIPAIDPGQPASAYPCTNENEDGTVVSGAAKVAREHGCLPSLADCNACEQCHDCPAQCDCGPRISKCPNCGRVRS